MLMQEFVLRFASKDEGSSLFEILRRISRVDTRVLMATAPAGWVEWPPMDDPGGMGMGIARA
jgi:hypothetical protein